MRKAWIAVAAAAGLFALLLGALAFMRQQLHVNGLVVLGWDSKRNAILVLHRPQLALDGPYVFRERTGFRVVDTRRTGMQWHVREARLPAHPLPVVTVRVDNPARTRFGVALRPPAMPAPAMVAANPSRLLMLSDLEGEFDRFVALLQAQGVIDRDLHWRYGDGHLALVGDLVDRGQNVVPLLWLVYRLEHEAVQAGGRVHYVLGNHELMLLAGDGDSWPDRMIATAHALGSDGGKQLFSPTSVLGQWLRSKPVVARVGDHLLAHGGISRDFLDAGLSITAANAIARPYLATRRVFMPARVQRVLGRTGVTRYRGLALADQRVEGDVVAHLQRVARRYGTRRVVIGHTIAANVGLEQDGLLLRLDVRHARQVPQAALYEGGRLWRVDARGSRLALD